MTVKRKITLKSPLAAGKLLLRAATVTERLGQPFSIDLDLVSPDENLDFDKLLGQEITLSVALDDGTRHFHGFVAHFAQLGRLGDYATYQARAVPWLWFLTRTSDCRIFQNLSVPDIVKQLFREHGFTTFDDTLTKTYRTRDYCVQYRETDLNFVQRLMEEEGIYYFFKHTDNSHTLVLADSYSGHETYSGYESIEYFPPSDNEVREKDHIHDWHLSRDVQPGKYVVMDYDFIKPRAVLKTQYVQQRNFPKSDFEMFDYPGGFTVTPDGDHYARARLESLQSHYERMNGVGNARGLATGFLFKLTGYPRKDQNKEHLIVAATHRLHAGDYETGTQGSEEDYMCTFEAVDAKEPFRAPIATRKPRVGGPQTAVVVGPSGEEIFTDKYGRVKVQFHWDREGERNEKSSCWVRVSQIWAGKNWGWVTLPRIGQEVVVDFLEGDPDQPLITGRVYNQDNMPPYDLPANKTQSGIKTRSSLSGTAENFNEIRFEDKKGSEQLYVHAEKNHDIVVENDESHSVGHDRKKDIGHDETTMVKHDRTETVKNNEKITIGVNRTEMVGSNETIAVGANQSITVGGHRTLTVSKAAAESIAMAKALSIGLGYQVSVGAAMNETIGAFYASEIGGYRYEKVAGYKTTDVGEKLSLNSDEEIVLKTGDSQISMKKDGKIEISGKDIKLKTSSGTVHIKDDGTIEISGTDTTMKTSAGKTQIDPGGIITIKGTMVKINT